MQDLHFKIAHIKLQEMINVNLLLILNINRQSLSFSICRRYSSKDKLCITLENNIMYNFIGVVNLLCVMVNVCEYLKDAFWTVFNPRCKCLAGILSS